MSVQENEVMGYKRPSSNSYYIVSFGLLVVFTIFVGLGVWAGTAPLAKAVSAIAKLSIKWAIEGLLPWKRTHLLIQKRQLKHFAKHSQLLMLVNSRI